MFEKTKAPNFENLIAALFNRGTDQIPLIELGIHPIIKSKILGRKFNGIEDDVEFMFKMGYDFVKVQPIIKFKLDQKKTDGESGNYSPDRAWATEDKGLISSMEDFEKYPWPSNADIDYSRFSTALNALPEGMGIIGQYGDIFTMVWELMGFESFAMATYTDPDLIKAMFEKVGELVVSMYEKMSELESVGCFWYSDDIAYATGLMMHPDFFREYLFPFMKRIGDLAKKKNVPFIYHSDGLLYDILDDIVELGVTSLHPIEPKSMDINELAGRYGDRLSFCGGIEVDLLSRGTTADIETITEKYLNEIGKNYSWCAGSSNSIPEYVNVDNYIAMVRTVHRFNGNI